MGASGTQEHPRSTQRPRRPSLLFAQGKMMHFVQDQPGHHDPKFTASVYGHLIPGDRRGEVDVLDGLGGAAEVRAFSEV